MSKWSSAFRDSRWQRKRLEIMERDGWACLGCGAAGEGVTLNVHHVYYESGRAPWEYPSEALVTWCETCHTAMHAKLKTIMQLIAMGGCATEDLMGEADAVIGFLDGMSDVPPHQQDKMYLFGYRAVQKSGLIAGQVGA